MKLNEIRAFDRKSFKFEAPVVALERWDASIRAAKKGEEVSINIYSTIGEYGDGAGMTPKIVNAILKNADGKNVTVNINSPGGDFFDGVAIHTLLSEYEGNVKVRVLGMAASAASVVALAGDEIEIAESGFFMIHNAWTIALGNKNAMRDVADMLAKFDGVMATLYAKKTGMDEKSVAKMMDAETWISGSEAVDMGFAAGLISGSDITEDEEEAKKPSALRKVDVALAKAGMPRSERRELIKELTGTPSAAIEVMPRADDALTTALEGLLKETQSRN